MKIIDRASIKTLLHAHSSLYAVFFLCLIMGMANTSNVQEEEVLAFEVKKYPWLYDKFAKEQQFLTNKLRGFLSERFDRLLSNKNIAIT